MAVDFEVTERTPQVGPDLTVVKVEFRPVPGEPVHSNIFKMQLWPTGRRVLVDGLGRAVTESGIPIPSLPDGLFPDENPADPFQREDFVRNNDREMTANIEAYWERKLRAAEEGKPGPQHHNTTLNLQVGASADDATETDIGGMGLTSTSVIFGSFSSFRHVGLRFTSVSGLSGQTIDAATLTFRASSTDTGDFVGDWFAHDVEVPGTFTTTDENITDTAQRPRTTTTCEGDGTDFGNWTNGADETFTGPSPSIVGIIQELADSHDPSAIALLFIYTSGDGERLARTYDHDTALAAKLDIDHSAGGATSLLPRYGHPMRHLIGR